EDQVSPDSTDVGSEQDITSAKSQIKGSWVVDDKSAPMTATAAYDFRPNGEFFRDVHKILNGVGIGGAPPTSVVRESGTYATNTTKHTITLNVKTSFIPGGYSEVHGYAYTPAKILNGVFLPGHGPHATLTLTRQAPPFSKIAYPSIAFDQVPSYC